MRNSIRRKLGLVLSAVVLAVLALVLLTNSLLLEKYYYRQKQIAMVGAFEKINGLYSAQAEELELEIEKIYANRNISLMIFDADNRPVLSSAGDKDSMPAIRNRVFRRDPRAAAPPDGQENPDLSDRPDTPQGAKRPWASSWPWGGYRIKETLLDRGEKFTVALQTDERLGSNFIDLHGTLDNGYAVFLRTPVEAIDEAVRISGKMYIYIGAGLLVLGLFAAVLIAKRFTRPILVLNDIAKKMADLDFSDKYTLGGGDEISALGGSINLLSERLKDTISALSASNEQLARDNALKQRIDQMRKEFIASASHELKTPLALISGYAEGLRDNIACGEMDKGEYCGVIIDETEKMNGIVKQLLSLMELESGGQQLNISVFNICETIRRVMKNCSVLMEKSGATVSFDGAGAVVVEADERGIMQVITNYLTNALNHVDDKKEIKIDLDVGADRVRVSVYNSGRPIPDEETQKIWESFYKIDKARQRDYGGTGLGLSIVKTIMRLHEMPFGAQNLPGGVRFYFELKTVM